MFADYAKPDNRNRSERSYNRGAKGVWEIGGKGSEIESSFGILVTVFLITPLFSN